MKGNFKKKHKKDRACTRENKTFKSILYRLQDALEDSLTLNVYRY